MAEAAINLTAGQKADRKLDMIFVNVGGSGTETWELLGRGVEDASVEYNHDTDTVLSAVRENMAAEEMAAENQPNQEKNE